MSTPTFPLIGMIELHQWPCHLFPSNEDYCRQTMTPNDPE